MTDPFCILHTTRVRRVTSRSPGSSACRYSRVERSRPSSVVANKNGDYTDDDVDALSTLGNTMWQILDRARVDGALREATGNSACSPHYPARSFKRGFRVARLSRPCRRRAPFPRAAELYRPSYQVCEQDTAPGRIYTAIPGYRCEICNLAGYRRCSATAASSFPMKDVTLTLNAGYLKSLPIPAGKGFL